MTMGVRAMGACRKGLVSARANNDDGLAATTWGGRVNRGPEFLGADWEK